jgi:hypothetical protein
MRNYLILLLTLFCAIESRGQKEVNLEEVTIKAARTIDKTDGKLIIPSEEEKQSSANGYSLLSKLSLPAIKIDAVLHTIKSADNRGSVQMRINGAVCSKEDLLSLNPKVIKSIDFIDNPGVRYGKDIAYVINIKTRKDEDGYTLGVDLMNTVSTWNGEDMAFAKWNHGNSEWAITYDFNYQDFRGDRYKELTDYLLKDGTHHLIEREDIDNRKRNFSNMIELKYNLVDPTFYTFQATLSTHLSHTPGDYTTRWFNETNHDAVLTTQGEKSKSSSPTLDLYFYHRLGNHQSVTANMTGTAIHTRMWNSNNEGTDYVYSVKGRTYSLTTEAIYENRLKPFTLSMGFLHKTKYTDNVYHGDVNSNNNMHNRSLYLFGEVKGRWSGFNYSAGMGLSNEHYHQGENRFNFWLFRPKITLAHSISDLWNIRYSFEVSQHISQVAMISDTRIRTNSMEWTVGNPDIQPNGNFEHSVNLSYRSSRFDNLFMTALRIIPDCNMASYSRTDDDQFLYMQRNQPGIKMWYAMDCIRWSIIPQKLNMSIIASAYRFINNGENYTHTLTSYQIEGNIQAYLGRWTITAYATNGYKFMEGETWNHQDDASYISCSYHLGLCDISLYWQHPFEVNPRLNRGGLENVLIHKQMEYHGRDYGNMISIGFSWKLNRGKQYHDINRKLHNKDTQTGILK